MFAKLQSRRSFYIFSRPTPTSRSPFPKSHGIISFTGPHPLNPVLSYRYKNIGRSAPTFQSPPPISYLPSCYPPKSFRIRTSATPNPQLLYNLHLQGPLGTAHSKGLITPLESALTRFCAYNPFRISTYRKQGVGWGSTFQVTFLSSRSHRMPRAGSGRAPWRQASGHLCGRVWLGG